MRLRGPRTATWPPSTPGCGVAGVQEGGAGCCPLDPGHRLASAQPRRALHRPGRRLLRQAPGPSGLPGPAGTATRAHGSQGHPGANSRLTGSQVLADRLLRPFSPEDEAAGSSPARPTTPGLSCGKACRRCLSTVPLPCVACAQLSKNASLPGGTAWGLHSGVTAHTCADPSCAWLRRAESLVHRLIDLGGA
jgi:hypothetical protein